MCQITAVLNVHREGLLALASLRSLTSTVAAASEQGLSIEMLVVGDRTDEPTRYFLDIAQRLGCRIVTVESGDLGLARNAAVNEARGRYVAFLDGDDLWSANWLTAAYAAAEAGDDLTAWHPECSIFFGAEVHARVLVHPDMTEDVHVWSRLAVENLWTALTFAPRTLLLRLPYAPTVLDAGQGYEDWSWNMAVVRDGGCHRTVPGTVHLVRVSPGSLVRRTSRAGALPAPTDLFVRRVGEPPATLGLV